MENQHNTNVAELAIELSLRQSSMAEVQSSKESCEKHGGIGYYDAFEIQSDKKDTHADRVRKLVDIVSELPGGTLIIGIVGMGGVGRTTLATKYFARRTRYSRFAFSALEIESAYQKRLRRDLETAITHLELVYRFGESNGHNFDIKSLDPTKMTQETYDTLVDIILFFEMSRLHELFLRAMMILCFIAIQIFLGLMVESYDSKAKIQEIKAMIQDKFNYNGNCNVKIGIIPERSGTPFLKMGVLRPTPMVQKVNSTQLVLRLTGAKLISREYDITSIVSKLSTSEVIVLPRGF